MSINFNNFEDAFFISQNANILIEIVIWGYLTVDTEKCLTCMSFKKKLSKIQILILKWQHFDTLQNIQVNKP